MAIDRDALRDEITRLSALYYEGTPEISDEEFDALEAEYLAAGGEEEVGHGYVPDARKVTHAKRMESLKKIKGDPEALLAWFKSVKDYYDENGDKSTPLTFSVSPKFDGLALAVYVEGGQVVRALTRGDGTVGEDVTQTAIKVPSVKALNGKPDGIYSGEILLPEENLALANSRRDADDTPLRQLRNAASGIIRKLNDTKNMAEALFFADHNAGAYVKKYSYEEIQNEAQTILLGFEPLRLAYPVSDDEHVGIDGVVFKVENADIRDALGSSSGSPRWARAYKFADMVYQSKITGVTWRNPGKIGRITPVVTYEVIHINGGEYTQATAHNRTLFLEFDPRVGDTVHMKKSGDVIPYIVKIDPASNRGAQLAVPTHCPSCGTETVVEGKFLMCPAPREQCDPVLGITFMIGALGIKGFGEGIIQKIHAGVLSNETDLHAALNTLRTIPEGSIAGIEGLGAKTESTLKGALGNAWEAAPLWAWIYSLNVLRVGQSVSKALEATYGSLDGILKAIDEPEEHYKAVPLLTGVNWEYIKTNRDRFEFLKNWIAANGVKAVVQQVDVIEDEFWGGKKVALTGSLDVSRTEAEEWLKTRGALPQKSFSGSTDILIDAGDGTSTKSRKAKEKNIPVVTGVEFMEQFNG